MTAPTTDQARTARPPCPPWCDRTHAVIHDVAGELGDPICSREIGRLDDGTSQLTIRVTAHPDTYDYDGALAIEIMHLENWGRTVEEMLGGLTYIAPREVAKFCRLLAEAERVIAEHTSGAQR